MLLGAVGYVVVLRTSGDPVGSASEPDVLAPVSWSALLLIVAILVIIDSVRKIRAGKTRELATGVFIVKLAAIPFFLINFAVVGRDAFAGSLLFVFGGGILLAPAVVGGGLTYLAMLSTSVYGWASVVQLRRERRIDTRKVVLYTFLLLIFVWDIAAGILLFADWRRSKKAVAAAR
jgi:hypothetical protein